MMHTQEIIKYRIYHQGRNAVGRQVYFQTNNHTFGLVWDRVGKEVSQQIQNLVWSQVERLLRRAVDEQIRRSNTT